MQRLAPFLSLFFALLVATLANAQPHPPIIVVGDSIPALASRVEAELEAIGFHVVRTSQTNPSEAPPSAVAIVQPDEAGGVIQVWIRDRGTSAFELRDQIEPVHDSDTTRAGWAIRAVESVRGGLLDIGIEPPRAHVEAPAPAPAIKASTPTRRATPSSVPPAPPTAEPRSKPSPHFPWARDGGIRFIFAQGGASPSALGTLGARWSTTPRHGWLLDLGAPLVSGQIEAREGTAVIRPYMASAGASFAWTDAVVVPSLEGGARVVWLRMRGEPEGSLRGHEDEAWLAGPWLGASATRHLGSAVRLRLEVSGLWAMPSREVTFVGRSVGSWGSGVLAGGLLLQVGFGGP